MAIFNLFNKKKVLVRCTVCYNEALFNSKEVHTLETQRAHDAICPIRFPCLICFNGWLIPVNYTDKNGKTYLFYLIKEKYPHMPKEYINELYFYAHEKLIPPY